MPKISIVLPVYNGIKYLKQSVDSVLAQDTSEFEFLILDDFSTDGSWEYLQQINDTRVLLFRNKMNLGLFYNLNILVQESTTSLIKLWSQDDVMEPNCISEILRFHQKHPQIGFSYSDRWFIDATGDFLNIVKEDLTPELISTDLHTQIAFVTGSIAGNIANVTISKEALQKVGLFNESMRISGDFEMWVRLARFYPIGFLKKPLIRLRIHDEQLSGQEKYFINHLKEDIQTYRILLGYISRQQQIDGMNLLYKTKLIFYYTLMVKAFLKCRFMTAGKFFVQLNKFSNIFKLTWFFLYSKFFQKRFKIDLKFS